MITVHDHTSYGCANIIDMYLSVNVSLDDINVELGMSSIGSSNWSSVYGNKSWYIYIYYVIYCCNEIYLKHSVHAVIF